AGAHGGRRGAGGRYGDGGAPGARSAVVVPVRGEPHRVRDLLPVRRLDRAVGPVTAGNGCRWGRGGGCAVLAVLGERRTGPRPRHRPAVAGSGCALPGKAVV